MAEGTQPREEFLDPTGHPYWTQYYMYVTQPMPGPCNLTDQPLSLYNTCQAAPWHRTETDRLMHHPPVPIQPAPPATPPLPRPVPRQHHHHHHLGPSNSVPSSFPPPVHIQLSPDHAQAPSSSFMHRPSCQYEQTQGKFDSILWPTTSSDPVLDEPLFPELSGLVSDLKETPPATAPLLSSLELAVGDNATVTQESKAHCLKLTRTPSVAHCTPKVKDQSVPFSPAPRVCRDSVKHFPVPNRERSAATAPSGSGENSAQATCYIPTRTPNPGEYGFRAKFSEDGDAHTRGKIWTYCEELNTLLVKSWCDFPVTFTVDKPLPPNCRVMALTCYRHTPDIQRHGPVVRCKEHEERDKMLEHHEHFLISKSAGATYSSQSSHNCVTVPVAENSSFAVYSCSCYSSCRFNGKPAPPMMIVFSLMHVGEPHITLGRDVLNLRACATPSRDLPTLLRKERQLQLVAAGQDLADPPLPKRRRLKRPELCEVEDPLDLVNEDPDEDGYFTFTWRLKNKVIFNILQMMKKGAELSELS